MPVSGDSHLWLWFWPYLVWLLNTWVKAFLELRPWNPRRSWSWTVPILCQSCTNGYWQKNPQRAEPLGGKKTAVSKLPNWKNIHLLSAVVLHRSALKWSQRISLSCTQVAILCPMSSWIDVPSLLVLSTVISLDVTMWAHDCFWPEFIAWAATFTVSSCRWKKNMFRTYKWFEHFKSWELYSYRLYWIPF